MAFSYQYQNEQDAIRAEANQWLARFAPLVMGATPYELEVIHRRLNTISELKQNVPNLSSKLSQLQTSSDLELSDTFSQASAQLESIDADLRRQLSKVAPGDPMGMVDIGALQNRLAEREARQEIGVDQTSLIPAVLELETSPSNIGAALAIGIFGIAWTAFTSVHCVLMIGGMAKAFGWFALGLLLFYSIFFMVGFAMLYAALNALCTESIKLEGRTMTIYRKLGSWTRVKIHELASDTKAIVGPIQQETSVRSENSAPAFAVNLTDEKGKGISISSTTSREFKDKMALKINEYLAAYG